MQAISHNMTKYWLSESTHNVGDCKNNSKNILLIYLALLNRYDISNRFMSEQNVHIM